jgi:hypothetical protein
MRSSSLDSEEMESSGESLAPLSNSSWITPSSIWLVIRGFSESKDSKKYLKQNFNQPQEEERIIFHHFDEENLESILMKTKISVLMIESEWIQKYYVKRFKLEFFFFSIWP